MKKEPDIEPEVKKLPDGYAKGYWPGSTFFEGGILIGASTAWDIAKPFVTQFKPGERKE